MLKHNTWSLSYYERLADRLAAAAYLDRTAVFLVSSAGSMRSSDMLGKRHARDCLNLLEACKKQIATVTRTAFV
jgi:hypothetical protein